MMIEDHDFDHRDDDIDNDNDHDDNDGDHSEDDDNDHDEDNDNDHDEDDDNDHDDKGDDHDDLAVVDHCSGLLHVVGRRVTLLNLLLSTLDPTLEVPEGETSDQAPGHRNPCKVRVNRARKAILS